ncbi:MAG: hypothetical protein KatS3mg081_0938 [Gemmatimonadales bacterium]|nr:DNA polymerase III subunit tau [bacterium HR33]GIW51583.1 MAG: hypothetical protein KatS3mg081_0938 [Gemmatimonadales bacterium]
MTYQALARKYRPKRFAELIGQDHVAAGLAGALARNRVAHAYLLAGPRGVGKTTAARILAMALNCERRTSGAGVSSGEPCAECDSCLRIWSGAANLDVVEIDAASNRGVDDARELRERAMYAASAPSRSKVYIVDEAHMLTREAWNALLKILEEPPPRVVFVFATTDPQRIANTAAPVLSRMQRFDFRRIGPQAIAERLKFVAGREGIEIEEDAVLLIARIAGGALRDALSLLDQAVAFGEGPVTAARVREALGLIDDEIYAEVLDLVAERRSAEVFPMVARLVEGGADLAEFVGGLGDLLRALMVRSLGGQPEALTDTLRAAVDRHVQNFQPGDLLRMLKLLGDAEGAVRRSANARLHVETLLLHWTLLDRTVELREVLQLLREGKPATGERAGRAGNPDTLRAAASAPSASESGSRVRLDPERLEEGWELVLEAVGRKSRILRDALKNAAVAEVSGERVVVEVGESEAGVADSDQARRILADAIAELVGRRLAVVVRAARKERGLSEPKRLDTRGEREERLLAYRARDPALDAAVEELDLELLE